MALKARNRNTGATPAPATNQEQAPTNQQTAPQNQPTQDVANGGNQMTNNTPATQNTQAPAVNSANAMATMNAGILDNIDDLNIGGNYVTMDGSEFLYKDTNETAKSIDIVVSFGKRFYQWFDEDNNKYNNSDTKLDDRYKMKFEIRWFEEGEEGEAKEYIMTLPTASAMNFINYVKDLSKKGYGVGQVVTRLTISRQENRNDSKIRYSRTEFEMVEAVQG